MYPPTVQATASRGAFTFIYTLGFLNLRLAPHHFVLRSRPSHYRSIMVQSHCPKGKCSEMR
ncbi:MAG: hypothetical protein EOP10_32335 [Proteobacteria bacterium]|nr:MAG: hypothetical protein EOP10_32335 [Pseudomonadota bacterium]